MDELEIKTAEVFRPLLQASRYKGCYGGRGSGKSHFFAGLLIETCIRRRTFAVCIRETQKSIKESVKRLLELKIEALGVGSLFEVMDTKIKCPYGGQIIFQGMQNHTAESIQSLESYDIAWVEESQSLSQRSLDLLRPTIRQKGSELWFSWNPKQPTDPVDVLLRGDDLPPNSVVVKANHMDNPFLPDVLRAEMEYDKGRDRDKYNHVWLGAYEQSSEARVFSNWRVRKVDAPEGSVFRFGADWGYANDPSVLVRCYIEGRTMYIDHEAYLVGCEIDQLPDLFDRVPRSRDFFITADSARPETISYMRRNGFPKINSAIKGRNSIDEGIEFLKSHDIVVDPRCEHTIEELKKYSYKVDPLTDEVLSVLEDKHNHVIDSLRYACEAARKAPKHRKRPSSRQSAPSATAWMG